MSDALILGNVHLGSFRPDKNIVLKNANQKFGSEKPVKIWPG